MGGGNNILLTNRDIEKLVVHVNLNGREIVEENDDFVIVKAQAGVKIGMVCTLVHQPKFWWN